MTELSELLNRAARARRDYRPGEAKALLVEAVALAREGDRHGLGRALAALGQIERDLGDAPGALLHYGEAADIAEEEGDLLALAHRLRHVGDIHQDGGRLDLAEPYYEHALALYRDRDNAPSLDLANALRPMAQLRLKRGDATAAERLWCEARTLYREAGVEVPAELDHGST